MGLPSWDQTPSLLISMSMSPQKGGSHRWTGAGPLPLISRTKANGSTIEAVSLGGVVIVLSCYQMPLLESCYQTSNPSLKLRQINWFRGVTWGPQQITTRVQFNDIHNKAQRSQTTISCTSFGSKPIFGVIWEIFLYRSCNTHSVLTQALSSHSKILGNKR